MLEKIAVIDYLETKICNNRKTQHKFTTKLKEYYSEKKKNIYKTQNTKRNSGSKTKIRK